MVESLERIVEPLLAWFEESARVLPWRENPTPYAVWVSEIMLQQTRVEAVKPYFARFLRELPDVKALANCPEERLLKLWEGLGYYNRVRNMQRAARLVIEKHGGRLPQTWEELATLPGIGSYTAGAIASFAYGQVAPAVDGNVLRVLARITKNGEDIARQSVKKAYERVVLEVIPQKRPGVFNQALMELGALICIPNGEPLCEACPVKKDCLSYRDGCQTEYPVKARAKARRIEERTVFVIRDEDRVAIHRRPPKGLLAGLFEPPNTLGHLNPKEALAALRNMGYEPEELVELPKAKHVFSHVEWRMCAYLVRMRKLAEDFCGGNLHVPTGEVRQHYPMPSAFDAYKTVIHENLLEF